MPNPLLKDRRLEMQGFACTPKSGIREIDNWLRFTPAFNTLWVLIGTAVASPEVLWLFAIVAGIGAVSHQHIFDSIYNIWIRKFTNTPPLPPNPKPRRFSMFLAALLGFVTGVFFMSGLMAAGYILGLFLAIAGALVATTHFCLGSWVYRKWEFL